MISLNKSFVIKALPILLIMFTVFTISLTENLQLADAEIEFIVAGQPRVFEMAIGGTEMESVNITNLKADEDISFEVYAVGEGSEFFLFEEFLTVGPKSTKQLEVFVIIPEDHPDNIEYHPQIKVLKRAPQLEEGVTGIRINMQQTIPVIIKIGDSPIFTAPEVEVIKEIPEEKVIQEQPKVEAPVAETIEEKMARIQAANQAKAPEEVIVDDVWQEEFEEEAVPEYEPEPYVAEPTAKQVPLPIEEKKECDFFAMFLSWFGIGKC